MKFQKTMMKPTRILRTHYNISTRCLEASGGSFGTRNKLWRDVWSDKKKWCLDKPDAAPQGNSSYEPGVNGGGVKCFCVQSIIWFMINDIICWLYNINIFYCLDSISHCIIVHSVYFWSSSLILNIRILEAKRNTVTRSTGSSWIWQRNWKLVV